MTLKKLKEEARLSLVKAAGRIVDEENLPDVTIGLIELATEAYEKQYGYVPCSWVELKNLLIAEEKQKKSIQLWEAKDRYRTILRTRGYRDVDLEDMDIKELQEEVELEEYATTTVALSNGCVSTKRIPFKKAA